ncbi:hypothetical protein KJ742_07095, partial [Patescibacteria group bacterium]|nr:hypothetical protein [Patescibacteria group bacterium]
MSKKFKQGFAKILPLSMITILVSGLFIFLAVQQKAVDPVYATGGSTITFDALPTITLTNDADSNSIANIGDTITISAIVTNSDGAEAGRACEMTLPNGGTEYGQVGVISVPLFTDNSGTSDVFTGTFVIADAAGGGIDVGTSTDTVTVGCWDADDTGRVTSASAVLAEAVDTIAPTIGTPGTIGLTDTSGEGVASIGENLTYAGGAPGAGDGDTWTVDISA